MSEFLSFADNKVNRVAFPFVAVDKHNIGECEKHLEAERIQKNNPVNTEVGVKIIEKIGEKVLKGENRIYADDDNNERKVKPYFDV
jgi:thymidine phosphorylase